MILKRKNIVLTWLLAGALLVFSMVIVGGITRLSNSGLSMVEWKLIMGAIPPLSEDAWQTTFEKYQQFPEYQKINYEMDLVQFKSIFWWEYIHRTLGRFVGLVFIFPFAFFILRKWLDLNLIRKCLVMFSLGALQGFFGWYMVKSGLVNDPHVSHYRLAIHLITATILFGYILWVMMDLWHRAGQNEDESFNSIRKLTKLLLGLILLQVVYGAFVAGLDAGKAYNTFPLMGDSLVAEGVTAMSPFWKNFTEGLAGVQFVHRYLAYAIVLVVGWIWLKGRKLNLSRGSNSAVVMVIVIVIVQFLLGVLTLINAVPMTLAIMHQLGAMLLFATSIYLYYQMGRRQV